jgi:N-acetylmuramoyl-L-alanine amidase
VALLTTKRHLAVALLTTKRHLAVAFLLPLAVAGLAHAQPVAPLVALDVGHYLAAPGATSARGVPEFEFNQALVQAVDARLRESGLRTETIGIDGMAKDLAARPRRAREAGALLFLSFHHDSARERYLRDWEVDGQPRRYLDDRFQGYSLFVSRQNPQWRQALDCASAIGTQLRAAGFKPSRYHADPVLGEAREFADEVNGVHFFDNLAVLRNATVPGVLFEAGVIVNRDEEARLALQETRARIAEAVNSAMPTCVTQAIKALGVPVPILSPPVRAQRTSAPARAARATRPLAPGAPNK